MTQCLRWSRGTRWLALVVLAGCAAGAPVQSPPHTNWAAQQGIADQPYVLQPMDTLTIKFFFNPELNEEVVIRPDGKISLQLIGDIAAAGRTPADLAAELTQRYTHELANPKVSVIVRQLGTPPVYVGGEVGRQGTVSLSGGMTLFQAIQGAGGLLNTAHRKQVILIRRGHDGQPVGYSIDVRPVASGEHPETDVPLRPYDLVFVPRSKIADVNVFVQQYVRNLLPITAGMALAPF